MEERAARLVSFLGTGKYEHVTHEFDGRRAATTPYVARALAELLRPAEVVILATAEAEAKHRAALERAFAEGSIAPPSFVRVLAGRDRAELFELFRILREQLRPREGSIVLDITHGFRAQPFFAASVVAFSRAVDPEPAQLRIVYGAFEQKREDGSAPIWDLSYLADVLDWASALRLFLRTGRADEAAAATESLGRELGKAWARGGKQGEQPKIQLLGEALGRFGADFETLRTGDLLLGRDGKKSSARDLAEKLRAAEPEVQEHLPPLGEVLNQVQAMVRPLDGAFEDLACPQGRAAVEALAKLYLRLGRYLEAIATVREGLINKRVDARAARPAAADFDGDERKRAEEEIRAAPRFKSVADLRNDLLHAQYRKRDSTRPAASVIDQVKRAVEEFAAPGSPPSAGG